MAMKAYDPVVSIKAPFKHWDALNQLTDNPSLDNTSTPEEDAEFTRITRNQEIAAMACVARTSPTTSAESVCSLLYDAGYRLVSASSK
ncbi:hypothetical protein [Shewanella acanthi]|uniref:hypothetical protein n=1 Tax=Shewanella acanthi TaxID=2864212 RepID=UPI001C655FF6|nr:hypothetical protein [Shewanella acanthi]QYJ79409.1 hypothetical protein K0H61_02885 [Shewanella acanthi]